MRVVRTAVRSRFARVLARRTTDLPTADVARPTIVLAPHPDDETLGCGGLIASKRSLGADVTVVFLTDGAASHDDAAGRRPLAERRQHEATEACARLGVDDAHLVFVGLPDGRLEEHQEAAVTAVAEVLRSTGATQLVLPHRDEPPPDHRVVTDIAERALREERRDAQLLSFPVWLWDQWPWTNPFSAPRARHSRRQVLHIAARDRLGSRLVRLLTHRHDIGDVLDAKRRALGAHESQVVRPPGRSDWITLADVADGEWLAQLLAPTEYYAVRTFDATLPAQ